MDRDPILEDVKKYVRRSTLAAERQSDGTWRVVEERFLPFALQNGGIPYLTSYAKSGGFPSDAARLRARSRPT